MPIRDPGSGWEDKGSLLRKQLSALAAAWQIEDYGIELYTALSERVKDKEGRNILQSLAQDEAQHKAWLEREIDRIFPGRRIRDIEPDPTYGITPAKVFALPDELTSQDEIAALEAAVEVEKRSARLYEEAAAAADDHELRAMMERLARWERGHQRILEDNLHYLRRGGSWYGYTPILDG